MGVHLLSVCRCERLYLALPHRFNHKKTFRTRQATALQKIEGTNRADCCKETQWSVAPRSHVKENKIIQFSSMSRIAEDAPWCVACLRERGEWMEHQANCMQSGTIRMGSARRRMHCSTPRATISQLSAKAVHLPPSQLYLRFSHCLRFRTNRTDYMVEFFLLASRSNNRINLCRWQMDIGLVGWRDCLNVA